MTPDEVRARVAEIAAVAGDNEQAHAEEDALYQDVLHAIALGAAEPQSLAATALDTKLLNFARWYA